MGALSLDDLIDIQNYAKSVAVSPCVVKTQAMADRMNELEDELGLSFRWKVGDAFYVLTRRPE